MSDFPFTGTTVVEAPSAPAEPEPSERQVAYLVSLATERGLDAGEIVQRVNTRKAASKEIDRLRSLPKVNRPAKDEPPEGIHFVARPDGAPGEGTIYKVQVAKQGSGRLYAKKLTDGVFVYEGRSGGFRLLSAETLVDLETAAAYGRLYGVCCRCGADLTDEDSIERGIGPVCAGRF